MPRLLTPLATAAALRALRSADFDTAVSLENPSRDARTVSLGVVLSKTWPMKQGPSSTANLQTAGTLAVRVSRATLDTRIEQDDRVAVEAPLEFQLHHPMLG